MPATTLAQKPQIQSLRRELNRIREGFSFRAVEKLQKSLGLPMEKVAAALGMSRATLHRRKLRGKIDSGESERLVRYQRLFARATELFGEADGARQWLNAPQHALGGAVPLDFAATEIGAREVENVLGRLEFGVYS